MASGFLVALKPGDDMYLMKETIGVKRWQMFAMLALSGFADGSIIAKLTTALGL